MPLQRNDLITQSMLTVYSSPSQLTDIRTGLPYQAGGSYVGIYFDLTEQEAQDLSNGQLHTGRYRFVSIDSAATAANLNTGSIALMASMAQGLNVVTSYNKGLATDLHQVVLLAPISAAQIAAGAYVFVQELGDASVLAATGITAAAGALIHSVANGEVSNGVFPFVGHALETATQNTLFRVLLSLPVVQG